MTGMLVLVALLLAWASPAAADLQGVRSEAAVGPNGTGEACRLRVITDEPGRGAQHLNVYCDGWSVASGSLFRFRVSKELTPERILTDSTFQRGYDARLGGRGAVEATTLGDGTTAAIRSCSRLEGGWPVVVVATVVGGRAVALETFPTNVRLLESALAVFQGKALPGAAREGSVSPVIRRAETIVGASGKLIGIRDIGAADTLWRLGLLDASEVATLKLDADWVVLSACNTAGPDGALGGESLSGLTRAFFYAGARALLVSHWAVASGPTVDLTTGMFGVYARKPGRGKAEALRRAQAAVRAKPETAHPFFWAALVLVGDGGAAP
jgi:hypothetical protein